MRRLAPTPEPPVWAVDAGLPEPRVRESFVAYVTRLGLDPAPLLADLTAQTACFANIRLASALTRSMPRQFHSYCRARYLAAHPPVRAAA